MFKEELDIHTWSISDMANRENINVTSISKLFAFFQSTHTCTGKRYGILKRPVMQYKTCLRKMTEETRLDMWAGRWESNNTPWHKQHFNENLLRKSKTKKGGEFS